MKNRILLTALAAVALFATSCSKTDESFEPTSVAQPTTYVNYSHTVSGADAEVTYTLQYLSSKGLQTIKNYKGSFSTRVPVYSYDSLGTKYVHTMFSVKTVNSDVPALPVINSSIKITADNGFVVTQTSQSAGGCGYSEREVEETTPLSWFSAK